ncbi:MAG: glycosyltransferase family 39 protein [Armatimonadota bacterium]|nr:glycosyltransferase family 39 protein [Armatimonadota bacterium]
MPKKPSQPDRGDIYSSILLLILIIGLALRIWGIFWTLPTSGGYSYHPDEIFQIASAEKIDLGALNLNPQFYNYGAMYMYLVSALMSLGASVGLTSRLVLVDWYLIARLLTALLGAVTPYLVFLTASRLFDRKVGLAAALLAAITPVAVVHSHFATVDAPATFWVAACLATSARLARGASIRSIIFAGLFAGFAGATKYTTAIVLIAPLVALLAEREAPFSKKLPPVGLAIAAALAGFVIGNPGCVLWADQFGKGFLYEFSHARQGHGLVFVNTGPGWLFHIRSSLLYGLGLPYLLLSLAGLCVIARQRRRESWFLLAFALVYFATISLSPVRFARYVIPLTPVLAITAAAAIVNGFDSIARLRWGRLRARQTLLVSWLVVCVGALYYTLSYSMALDRLFDDKDPRFESVAWIKAHVPKGSAIALPTRPWFYSPAFSEWFTHPLPEERFLGLSRVKDYRLLANPDLEWDSDLLRSARPDYVVVSDYEDLDAVRAKDPAALEYLRILRARYAVAAVIADRLRGGGLDFGTPEHLPHDLKYASPRLTIYKRRT